MKKIFFSMAMLWLLLLASCSDKDDKDEDDRLEMGKQHIEKVQAVANAFETGDTSKINDLVAADFIDHTDRGDMGRDSLKAAIILMHQADSSLKFNSIRAFGDDEYGTVWYKLTGTSDGNMGLPKGPYSMHSIDMVRFNKEGKAVEHWSFIELQETMKMMSGMMQTTSDPGEKKITMPAEK